MKREICSASVFAILLVGSVLLLYACFLSFEGHPSAQNVHSACFNERFVVLCAFVCMNLLGRGFPYSVILPMVVDATRRYNSPPHYPLFTPALLTFPHRHSYA